MPKLETYLNKDGLYSIFTDIARQCCKEKDKKFILDDWSLFLRDLAGITLFGFENAKIEKTNYRNFESIIGLVNGSRYDDIVNQVAIAIWNKAEKI